MKSDAKMHADVARLHADANVAADQSLEAAVLAKKAAQDVERGRRRVEELTPDPRKEVLAELAALEGAALPRIGPRRRLWRELQRHDEELVEIEQRRDQLVRELNALSTERSNEPDRHAQALAAWIGNGSKGDRPQPRTVALNEAIADLQAEYAALGVRYDALLREQAEHVIRNRKAMAANVREAKEPHVGEEADG